ncbi:YcxB family protein [Aequorivita marina]|uniref:YcxB family protein n=1 Tax=Aequorivita marina TaxID=3073654 RepID=UPI0028754DBE|nr:YcxB family protein [Aequorivita sp. S2608]MDS1297987.1 YcxB family protein [Aequorivita sp. S2608]
MNFTYKLNQKDYLQHTLYYYSTNKDAKKMRTKAWIVAGVMLACFCGILALYADTFAIYFGIGFSLFCFALFPFFHKFRLKKIYRKSIKNLHKNNFDKEIQLFFNQDHIKLISATGESKINYSALEKVIEVSDYYYMVFQTGTQLIIPKEKIDSAAIESKLKNLTTEHKIRFSKELDWKW